MISVDWRARHLPRLHGVRVQPVPLLWGGARPRPLPPLLLQGRLWDGGGPHGGTGNPLGLLAPRGSLRSANPPTDSFPAWKPALCHKDLRPDLSPRVSGYSRLGGSMSSLGPSMYPGSYPTSEQNPYPSIAMDNSAFYGSLVS